MVDNYDAEYFSARSQDKDRPALWFYERIIRRWIKNGAVLDYGCGTGFLLKRLAKYYDVAGFDLSSHARTTAKNNVPSLTVYDDNIQIPDQSFSGIVSLHVLEHIEESDLNLVLNCWHRVLLPQGRVLCVVPDALGRGRSLAGKNWTGYGDPTHVSLLGHNVWSEHFASSGFSVKQIGTDGLWCLPYREGKSKIQDGLRFSIPTVLQFLSGRLILPAGHGESAIFLLVKS